MPYLGRKQVKYSAATLLRQLVRPYWQLPTAKQPTTTNHNLKSVETSLFQIAVSQKIEEPPQETV